MSGGWDLSKLVSPETLTCPRCGSASLYPHPGLLGELGGVLGRVRYACRDCCRQSWLRPGADPEELEYDAELELPPPEPLPSLDGLDVETAPVPASTADLTALDRELALVGGGQRRR